MKQQLSTLALFLLAVAPVAALPQQQTQDTVITLTLQKVDGLGPEGMSSVSVGDRKSFPDEIQQAIPAFTGIPEDLTNVNEYYIILNKPQFFYQHYKGGKIGQATLFQVAKDDKWPLADTAGLSAQPLECGIAVVTGLNPDGQAVYLADVNQNYDFSDDATKTLLPVFEPRNSFVPVRLTYAANGDARTEELHISLGMPSQDYSNTLMVSSQNLRFIRFAFNGRPYVLCTSGFSLVGPSITVLPDRPFFQPVPRGLLVRLNEYVNLDGYLLTFSGYRDNGHDITLSGEFADIIIPEGSTSAEAAPTMLPGQNSANTVVASQTGFTAPEIAGLDVLTGDRISLSDLRGKWVYVDFWSTACGPCIAEFPRLKQIFNKADADKVAFIGVVEERGEGSVRRLLEQHQLPWKTIQTGLPETVTTGYNVYSFPTTFLIDPEGVIRHQNIRSYDLEATLEGVL